MFAGDSGGHVGMWRSGMVMWQMAPLLMGNEVDSRNIATENQMKFNYRWKTVIKLNSIKIKKYLNLNKIK